MEVYDQLHAPPCALSRKAPVIPTGYKFFACSTFVQCVYSLISFVSVDHLSVSDHGNGKEIYSPTGNRTPATKFIA
jgi:hypothetical protein